LQGILPNAEYKLSQDGESDGHVAHSGWVASHEGEHVDSRMAMEKGQMVYV
jgi:hypothetical protein